MKIEELSIADKRLKKFAKAYQYAMDMTKKETKQAAEGLFHNLNTLQSRSGNQLPFTSINYGLCIDSEGRMVTKALLEVSIEGLGKFGRTSIFPCGIFQVKSGVNKEPGTPNYDLYRLALRSTAQRLYPNYANCDWSNQKGWLKQDRKMKRDYLGRMDSESYQKLHDILEEHKDIQERTGLVVSGDAIEVEEAERPEEIFSTMGKCNTAAHLKSFEPCLRGVA